ncbi:NADAR family protein, partial [bacterium]|nr:NADAR family protein [bacterium]
KYFNFIDNEGASDGFFAVIRDALLTQGRTTTILELRKQLSEEVNDEVFREYREKFAMYHGLTRTQTRETKELVNQYNDVKRRISAIHDRAQQQLMIAGAKKLVVEHNLKHDEMKYTKLLSSRYDYMREVRSTQQLKERMMTSLYWPDAWAIATMERVLNMKFVVFSRDAYEAGDIDNVLQCDNGAGGDNGGGIDADIRKRGVFEPTAYILIGKASSLTINKKEKEAAHSRMSYPKTATYNLITYKTHGVLAFSELPYDIKLLITTKCLETQAGAFCLIPQFKLFQRELGIRADDIPNESLDDLLEEIHTTGTRAEKNLYTTDIVFQFYAKSNPNALPGMGAGEKIPETEKIHFHKLATFDNWRRKLSNFWNEPFMLDGHTWQSVEHYYQASKFKNNNREFYLKFSLDSRSQLSADPLLAKAAGSKSGKLNHTTIIRPSRITIDPDFFNHG